MKQISLVLISMFMGNVFAQDLNYPELEVVPRASERLVLEQKDESSNLMWSMLPYQVSAISTIMAATQLTGNVNKDKDENEISPTIGLGVGVAWLGLTGWATFAYRPYSSALGDIAKIKASTTREQLMRERMAEEEINQLRGMAQRMKWLSVVSNLGASLNMLGAAEGESDAKMYASISSILAFMPLFTTHRWEVVSREQEKYKKKIYRPITLTPNVFNVNGKYASGLSLSLSF